MYPRQPVSASHANYVTVQVLDHQPSGLQLRAISELIDLQDQRSSEVVLAISCESRCRAAALGKADVHFPELVRALEARNKDSNLEMVFPFPREVRKSQPNLKGL